MKFCLTANDVLMFKSLLEEKMNALKADKEKDGLSYEEYLKKILPYFETYARMQIIFFDIEQSKVRKQKKIKKDTSL